MSIKIKNIIWHVTGCLAFLIVPIILSPRPPHMPLFSRPTLRDFLANCLMLVIFYLNFYFFIPKLYFKKRNLAYGLVVFLGFLMITILPSLLTGHIPWNLPSRPPGHVDGMINSQSGSADFSILTPIKHNIFLYIAVILFSLLLRVRTKLFTTELLKHDAELETLKRQINPHFLFNTLNSIYAYALRERSTVTASGILKLSGMMRYMVTDTLQEFVPLEKEIAYTNDYIELQKMRLTENMNLSYTVTGIVKDQKIAPVILMPFIENAFKHGVNPDEDSSITIEIHVADSAIELNVENKKVKTTPEPHTKSGVGLENTRARLELLYPQKYSLSILDDQRQYRVKLKIQLT